MKSTTNRYKPAKLLQLHQKLGLQIAIAVAKGFAYFVDSNDLPDMRSTR